MTTNTNWREEQWKEFDITARFADIVWDGEPHGFDFELFEIVGWEHGKDEKKLYERKGAIGGDDFSLNGLEDAQPYLTGMIKWDGCSHFYFGDDGYLHLCGLNDIEKLQNVLKKLVALAETKGVERL